MLLFNAGLYQVISFTGGPHFPGPWESSDTIATYFQGHPKAVMICAFLQFGAAIPLGKALLAADMGDWIKLDDGRSAKIVKIEFKQGRM
jgi:hypothetical protein